MLVVAGALLLWGGWFVYRSSFLVGGVRHFSLFDDAMISMVYARNLAEGFGLNWARWGDPVEGFSCPLWTLLMVPVNLSPLPLPLRSLAVQLTSLALLVANLFALRRLVLEHFATPRAQHWLPAVVLTASYFPLNHWALMGMETALQALLMVSAVHLSLDVVRAGRPRGLALGCVLALAILLRMDMALLAAACAVYAAPSLRRAGACAWLPGALVLAGSAVGYEAFRLAYFGDPLPNTYYLKLTGTPAHVRIAHGLMAFVDFARPILLPLLGLGMGCALLRRERPQLLLPAAVVLLYFAYAIYVGGDVYDFFTVAGRFVCPVMPLLFVLVNGLLNEALERSPAAWRSPRATRYALAGAVAAGVLLFNGLLGAQTHNQWRAYFVFQRPLHVEKHASLVRDTQRLSELVAPDALVATSWAGLPPYFSDFRFVDWLGYSNRRIAHMPAVSQLTLDGLQYFDAGHIKWDIPYIVDDVKPDVIYLHGSMREPIRRYAAGYDLVEDLFWLRRDSDRVQARPASGG